MSFGPGTCLSCGKTFTRVRRLQRFCRRECKYAYRRQRDAQIQIDVQKLLAGEAGRCPHCHGIIAREAGAPFSARPGT